MPPAPTFYHDPAVREKWRTFVLQMNPDIDPKTIRLLEEMRLAAHALHEISENSVVTAGLSYAKYRLLMGLMIAKNIEGRDEMNPSEISERQGTSRNTISALIRDLEDEGLIERQLDQQDKRKFNIRLTPAGTARLQAHAGQHMRVVSECFSELSNEEQDLLSQILQKLGASAKARSLALASAHQPVS